MADMQSGVGPFVGVFLQERGWASGLIGTAMTIGNVAGMLITTPIGGFIDSSRNKRIWVVIPGICVVAASAIILISQNFWAVTASQIAQSLASAAIVPAVTGITLGIVKQSGFNQQNGRNQAFNHAGNLVGASAVRLSRLEIRLSRSVRAGGGIRRNRDCLRAHDSRAIDR
jgi:MFS family permease